MPCIAATCAAHTAPHAQNVHCSNVRHPYRAARTERALHGVRKQLDRTFTVPTTMTWAVCTSHLPLALKKGEVGYLRIDLSLHYTRL